jgi:hypothetical protein
LNNRKYSLLALTALLGVLIALSFASAGKSETGEQQATFAHVTYSATIHAGDGDTWIVTVRNRDCSGDNETAAQFFLKFYADGELFFDEFNSTSYKTWPCLNGSTVANRYKIAPWSTMRPVSHDIRVELYWYSNGAAHLEDVASFMVAVTIHMALQDIFATSYLIGYVIACFVLLAYNYAEGLEE